MTQTLLDVSLDMSRPYPGTPAERAARGKAARRHSPRSAHAAFTAARDRADPVVCSRQQAATPGAGAGADPVRPDAGLAVHVLPRRRPDHGRRPRRQPRARGSTAQVLRGRTPVQLRRSSRSPERRLVFDINDFDETLPGPVGVGRQAPGGEPAIAGAGQRVLGEGAGARRPARCRRVPGPHGGASRRCRPRPLVPALRDRAARRGISRQVGTKTRKRLPSASRRRARETTSRHSRSSPRTSAATRTSSRDPPLIVPRRGARTQRSSEDFEQRVGAVSREHIAATLPTTAGS